jgi:hypothetical protein
MRSFVAGLALALVVGCASFRQAVARQQFINGQVQGFVYAQPVDQVWPFARQLLFESGYELDPSGSTDALTIETQWLPVQNGDSMRLLVQGMPVDATHCRVQFTRYTQHSYGAESGRALDFEWSLLQRVDPQAAQQIQSGADQQAANTH